MVVYICDGFWILEVLPSPKLQLHPVGLLAVVSVKCTVNGLNPIVVSAKNPADGGNGGST